MELYSLYTLKKKHLKCSYTEELEFSSNTVISVLACVIEEFLIFTESRYVESRCQIFTESRYVENRCQSSNLYCWES